MKEILLTNGVDTTLVDDDAYDALTQYKWTKKQNVTDRVGYALTRQNVDGKRVTIYMHRLLCPGFPRVDHRNGDSLDNRRENLRGCTHAENLRNQQTQVGRKYKGVCIHRNGRKWRAYIGLGGAGTKHLGYFPTEEGAALAYDAAARLHFGEFARLNFPAGTAQLDLAA